LRGKKQGGIKQSPHETPEECRIRGLSGRGIFSFERLRNEAPSRYRIWRRTILYPLPLIRQFGVLAEILPLRTREAFFERRLCVLPAGPCDEAAAVDDHGLAGDE
jgi:hypothetical protein